MEGAPTLPLGAVRAGDGSVVVPESRRADGSVRKTIRIRQGYVPQDEVPKYKPIGQRMREQQARERETPSSETSADAIARQLGALSLAKAAVSEKTSRRAPPAAVEAKRERPAPRARQELTVQSAPPTAVSSSPSASVSAKELKSELSTVNKSLREIAKLEAFEEAHARGDANARPLTAPQKRKLERKANLEMRRQELIDELDSDKPTRDEAAVKPAPSTRRVIEL